MKKERSHCLTKKFQNLERRKGSAQDGSLSFIPEV